MNKNINLGFVYLKKGWSREEDNLDSKYIKSTIIEDAHELKNLFDIEI